MTKVKLKDATKDLLKNAEDVLGNVAALRKKASAFASTMKKTEAKFASEEEQKKAEEKKAEQQRLISQQTKAYTMPDTDEPQPQTETPEVSKPKDTLPEPEKKKPAEAVPKAQEVKPAENAAEKPAPMPAPIPTPVALDKAEKVQSAPVPSESPSVAAAEKPVPKPAPVQVSQKEETKESIAEKESLHMEKAAENKEKKQAKPEPSKPASHQAAAQATAPQQARTEVSKGASQPAKAAAVAEEKPIAAKPAAAPAAQAGQSPRQPAAQPGNNARPANAQPAQTGRSQNGKPVQNGRTGNAQAGNNGRPVNASQGQPARETNPQQNQAAQPGNGQPRQPGRPVNPQQGQYGRPVNPQQGQYGRPVNSQQGQQYGRPVNPQQGQYGRPVNPQQGQYGRPVNPQQGQQYGRPVNPQQGQQYGRPVNPQQGQYGRPVNPQQNRGGAGGGQGGFNRPAGGQQGQFNRGGGASQGGNRPQGGGFGNNRSGGARKPALDMAPTVEKERVSNYDPNKKNYIRQHDPERVAKNKKQLAKESMNGGYDDEVVRGGRRAKAKKPSAQQLMAPIKIEKAYMTAERISIKDLTERIGKPAGEILKKLFLLGQTATINTDLDFDTASLVCSDFGIELEMNLAKTAEDNLAETDYEDNETDLVERPPVVTIMGHVDHGKTSLLDYIRKSKVTAGEAGGITQHIGAYTVNLNGRAITFLDTPGHEAFTAMRARGAQSTDIAVLVVAADDGVMPQTVEAINHAKAAEVPIIVAINKMDKPTANPERVKQDLTAYNLVAEEWGGDTIMVPVSALTGDGVDDLLEMILLQADMLQLRANPNRMAKGVIIEAKLDKSRGPLATVLLQNGTLHVGDNIVAGMASGRVRALVNDRGERVKEAGPSMPVEISGFADVPCAGDDMMAVADDHLGRQVVQERKDKAKAERNASVTKVSLDNLFSRIDQSKLTTLNIVVKADVQGSVEAVKQALEKLSTDEVKVRILHSAVGAITKDDVNLASAFDAIIIGFNIRPDAGAKEAAAHEGVDVRLYRVIYQAIEDIQKAMKGLLEPEYKENLLGHAEVRNTFHITGAGTVAGCYVKDGKVQRNAQVRLLRDNVVVYEGKLSSLKRYKDDVKEVAEGYECGISFDNYNDIKEGDLIECFVLEEIER